MRRAPAVPLRRPFTPEEQRLIDEAIRAGRYTRINGGGWTLDALDGARWTWG